MESFRHIHAKETLCGWLRDSASNAEGGIARFGGFSWRVDGCPPDFGIYTEYPIADVLTGSSCIDDWQKMPFSGMSQPPKREELKILNHKAKVIFDVAIRSTGLILFAFEVIHKSPASYKKIAYLSNINCAVFNVSANWIESQIKGRKPRHLKVYDPFGGLARWLHDDKIYVTNVEKDWGFKEYQSYEQYREGGAA